MDRYSDKLLRVVLLGGGNSLRQVSWSATIGLLSLGTAGSIDVELALAVAQAEAQYESVVVVQPEA